MSTFHIFSQPFAFARVATQVVISQARELFWLLVVVVGCLGLLVRYLQHTFSTAQRGSGRPVLSGDCRHQTGDNDSLQP